jgi:hypothetical protein
VVQIENFKTEREINESRGTQQDGILYLVHCRRLPERYFCEGEIPGCYFAHGRPQTSGQPAGTVQGTGPPGSRLSKKKVLPHVPEAWINLDSVKIGYEISFNKYFYRHKPLRSMEAVAKDILDLEHQAEGLIADILGLNASALSGADHD